MRTTRTAFLAGACLVLAAAVSSGAEVGGPGGVFAGRQLQLHAGIVRSDIGGGAYLGPVVALSARGPDRPGFGWFATLEYTLKGGSGDVTVMNAADGTTLYAGEATVRLHYAQLGGGARWAFGRSRVRWDVYAGAAPALLVSEKVDAEDDPDVKLATDWYRDEDILALAGCGVRVGRFSADLQAAWGLLDLEEGHDSLRDGESTGPSVSDGDDRSFSLRLAAGVAF